jgi:hypothetical protein
MANKGVELLEIGRVLGHNRLSSTARYSHHSPARLVATALVAAQAWDLLPEPAATGSDSGSQNDFPFFQRLQMNAFLEIDDREVWTAREGQPAME